MINNKKIFIIQNPIGIASFLQIYDDNNDSFNIIILCIGSLGIYSYIKNLNLKCELLYIKPVAFSSNKILYLFKLYLQYRKIISISKSYDSLIINSLYQDIFTITLVNEILRKGGTVKIIKSNLNYLLDNSIDYKKNNIINNLITCILKYIIKADLEILFVNEKRLFRYQYWKKIPEIDVNINKDIFKKYGIILNGNAKRNILLIESLGTNSKFYKNYKKELSQIIDKLVLIGKLYVKPHPTYGISKFLENDKRLTIIEKSIPAAMINLINFDYVIGIESVALKEIRHNKIYSIIDLFSFNDNKIRDNFKRYLVEDNNTIIFIDSISFLK